MNEYLNKKENEEVNKNKTDNIFFYCFFVKLLFGDYDEF